MAVALRAKLMRQIPAAVAHIQKYPVVDLDAGTLRILRDECKGWLTAHHKITAEIEEGIAAGRTAPDMFPYWNDTFKEDVDDSENALTVITAELDRRGLN